MPQGRKVNCCSTCGNPSRGHVGPQGKRCKNNKPGPASIIYKRPGTPGDGEVKVEEQKSRKELTVNTTDDNVLKELANQIGQLSLGMQHMQKDITDLKAGNSPAMVAAPARVDVRKFEDVPRAADTYECLSSGAKVPTKVLRAAKQGEFVNLADFAPVLEPSNTTETSLVEGELIFKPKRAVKNIDSFLIWSLAWRGYEELLIDMDPSLYKQMVDYRIFIQTCSARYWWYAVYSYDVRNRAKCSMSQSFNFNRLDNDIYVSCMDAATARTNVRQCSRCKSIWHFSKDCPFQTEGPVEASTRPAKTQNSSSVPAQSGPARRPMSQQICFSWNSGRCYNNACARLHNVCQGCGGAEPLFRCRNCAGQNRGNSQAFNASAPNFVPGGSQSGSQASGSSSYASQQGRVV